jgi:hypothetical protein
VDAPAKHPLISVYGRTPAGNFPLILVVGREPNDTIDMGGDVGPYDFDRHPRTGFWNIAYKLVGEVDGVSVKMLKRDCRERGSSVLTFADVSSTPIPSKLPKAKIRKLVSANYSDHLQQILSNTILDRVELVILSGISDSSYDNQRNFFIKGLMERKKRSVELPFFYGTNYPKIKAKFSEENLAVRVADILQMWRMESSRITKST